MMRASLVRLTQLLGLGALVLVAGCFQVEQKYIVYSDGSGKSVQTMTIDPSQLEMLKGMAPPGAAGGGAPGLDVTKTVKGTMGQKAQFVAIAYFEDVSKVEQPGYTFEFAKHDDGGCDLKLSIDLNKVKEAAAKGAGKAMGGMPGAGGGDDGGEDLGEKPGDDGGEDHGGPPGGMGGLDPGMMEGVMSQMKTSILLVFPGEVTETSAGEKSGRTVTYVIEGQEMTQPKEMPITISASCSAPAADAKGEFEAFQKELEDVKKADAAAGAGK